MGDRGSRPVCQAHAAGPEPPNPGELACDSSQEQGMVVAGDRLWSSRIDTDKAWSLTSSYWPSRKGTSSAPARLAW